MSAIAEAPFERNASPCMERNSQSLTGTVTSFGLCKREPHRAIGADLHEAYACCPNNSPAPAVVRDQEDALGRRGLNQTPEATATVSSVP